MGTPKKAFAEVIESSLYHIKAQTWQWDEFPVHGSLVCFDQNSFQTIGIVTAIETGSMDPVRYPFAYQKTEEELHAELPQIFEFLKTTFTALIIGFKKNGRYYYTPPVYPAKIHSFVAPLESEHLHHFLSCTHYLHRLFSAARLIHAPDELFLAFLYNQSHYFNAPRLRDFIKTYALLVGNDYRRIKLFLQQVEQLKIMQDQPN